MTLVEYTKIEEYDQYNMTLRSEILIYSLMVEDAATWAIRAALWVFKNEPKALGNKSSTLSLKNKIDLLHDLDVLPDTFYVMCVKFLEIRNQFVHNPDCNEYKHLEKHSDQTANYLKKTFSKHFSDGKDGYYLAVRDLWSLVVGILLAIKGCYLSGVERDDIPKILALIYLEFDQRMTDILADCDEEVAAGHPVKHPIISLEEFLMVEIPAAKTELIRIKQL